MLPPEFISRCTHSDCSWHVGTMPNRTTTPEEARRYRDQLATAHTARYGHTTTEQDHE